VLQVLFRPVIDALERLLQILQRISHAEAQVAFAEGAERRTGKRRFSFLRSQTVAFRTSLLPR
jgi:hypothetical protein